MRELKRQAREMISDLIEKHCNPCTKQAEMGVKDSAQFGRDYCNVECAVGRDLKKLGDYLITKGDKTVKAAAEKLNKEMLMDLLAQGKKNKEIAKVFGMSLPNYYAKKKEWGLTNQREVKPKVSEVKEMPIIQPDYSREIEKYENEIAGLRESNKLLSDKLKEVEHIQAYNRETHQQNAELVQETREMSKTITALLNDYKALQTKYESLVTYTKEIM